jgi:LysM repeat protein
LLVLGGVYFWWKRRNVKLYGGIGWIAYKTEQTDSIVSLSQEHKVDWKVLVKTNKLKAPYILEAGQEILVPGDPEKIAPETIIPDEKEKQKQAETAAMALLAADIKETKVAEQSQSAEIIKDIPQKKTVTLVIAQKTIWLVAAAVILSAVVFAVIFSANRKQSQLDQSSSISSLSNCLQVSAQKKEAEEAAAQQAARQVVEKTKADLVVHILNGGAKPGSAAKMKSMLEKSGYENADTANAQEDNSVGIAVFYKDGFQKSADDLVATLKTAKIADVAVVQPAVSDEEKSGDLVVILGK